MSDLHDVETALRSLISRVLYPNGNNQPSLTGAFTRIIRGWPLPTRLDADLKAGKVTVSIFPRDDESRTTRYARDWEAASTPEHTLLAAIAGDTVTISGTPSRANVALFVDGKPYVYQAQASDTLASIAAGLSGLIDPDRPSSAAGATFTVPNARTLVARIGGFGTLVREVRRQKRSFQVTCWCPDPATRDATAAAIDDALAAIDYLDLPDGTAGRLLYQRSHVDDAAQESGLYRRDLLYSVEYATTQARDAAEVVVERIGVEAGGSTTTLTL